MNYILPLKHRLFCTYQCYAPLPPTGATVGHTCIWGGGGVSAVVTGETCSIRQTFDTVRFYIAVKAEVYTHIYTEFIACAPRDILGMRSFLMPHQISWVEPDLHEKKKTGVKVGLRPTNTKLITCFSDQAGPILSI